MIDFHNASYVKLGQIDYSEVVGQIEPLLIEGEQGFVAYKGKTDVAYLNKLVAHHVL